MPLGAVAFPAMDGSRLAAGDKYIFLIENMINMRYSTYDKREIFYDKHEIFYDIFISTAKRCSYNSPTQRSNPIPYPIHL